MAAQSVPHSALLPVLGQADVREILRAQGHNSGLLTLARRILPNLATNKVQFPFQSVRPKARFVGASGIKPVTTQAYDELIGNVAKLAAIKVYENDDLNDALENNNFNLIAEDIPVFMEEADVTIARAILWGDGAPPQWSNRPSLFDAADAAGAVIDDTGGLYQAFFGANGAIARVRKSGFRPNGILASPAFLGALTGLVDNEGRPLFIPSMTEGIPDRLGGMQIVEAFNGEWDDSQAMAVVGDFDNLMYILREEISFRESTDSTITDLSGNPTDYLFMENKTAILMEERLTWQLSNVPQMSNSVTSGDPFPFAFYAP